MTDDAWLETVRVVRDTGTVSALLPPEFPDIRDCPHTLFEAITLGLRFLGFDELPDDERPPKRIWLDASRLTDWFDEVKRKRNREMGGGGGSGGSNQAIEDPVDNEAAKGLIVG